MSGRSGPSETCLNSKLGVTSGPFLSTGRRPPKIHCMTVDPGFKVILQQSILSVCGENLMVQRKSQRQFSDLCDRQNNTKDKIQVK